MRAEDFPALLGGMELPGVEVKPANGKPGSGMNHGFLVTSPSGARLAWQVVSVTDGADPIEGAPAACADQSESTGETAAGQLRHEMVAAAICAWLTRSPAATFIAGVRRYESIRKDPGTGRVTHRIPGIRLDLHNGDLVCLQLLWTLKPGEEPSPQNKYQPVDAV